MEISHLLIIINCRLDGWSKQKYTLMYNRVSLKHSMTGGKRKLEWHRVRKYIRFLMLLIPRASNCKKPYRGFSEILLNNITYKFTSFSYFDPTNKSAIFFNNFQRHSLLTALQEKNLRMRTMYFLVLVF